MTVLILVLAPMIVLVPVPAVRAAAGTILLLIGLIAWACAWAVRSV